MNDQTTIISDLSAGRERFLALIAEIRPDLHRYCARLTGSVTDGEDIVQDTVARAFFSLAELDSIPPLRPWLFRIAHNRAIDFLRGESTRLRNTDAAVSETPDSQHDDPLEALMQKDIVGTAVSRFVVLPPTQRSVVILKDVLDHSLNDIAGLLHLSVDAVKAALHRGRVRLRQLNDVVAATAPREPLSLLVKRYVSLFNARDWDSLRRLLAEDVRLDQRSRAIRIGRTDVSVFFSNYDRTSDWFLVPGWLQGREVVAVLKAKGDTKASYFMEIGWHEERIVSIRDYRYVSYVAAEAEIVLAA